MNQFLRTLVEIVFFFCLTSDFALAHSSWSRVIVTVRNPPEVLISIQLTEPVNNWSFRNAYAGALGLADRVQKFQATGSGEKVSVRTLANGEFSSATPVDRVSYIVDLSTGSNADLPHVSWFANEYAVLMLADLLPISPEAKRGVTVEFDLPAEWQVYSSLSTTGKSFVVDDSEKTVFIIGRSLRLASRKEGAVELRLITQGNWKFSDKELLPAGLNILQDYQELTGFKLRFAPTIFVAPFPGAGATSKWKAETRGSTSTVLLNPEDSKKNSRAKLAIILTHELFHFWVPNSLSLTGDYDWFFEGFTSYVALQEALKSKLIRFEEYLKTLGRVYDSNLSVTDDWSLLEASERRWTSSPAAVYDKGMLVAFIYDLITRRESDGAQSLANRYRALFARYADKPAIANEAIIGTLTGSPATSDFAKSYIESRNRIELEKILPAFGIEVDRSASRSELRVSKELRDDQKKLLRSLGYRK